VIVDPEIIKVLVDYAEGHPEAGVMGCKIFYFGKDNLLWSAGGRIHPLHGHSRHFGWNRKDHPRYDKIRECDLITGCGFSPVRCHEEDQFLQFGPGVLF